MHEAQAYAKSRKGIFITDKFVPAKKINSLADITICHGGQGTVQTAAASGTPIVGIAQQPEQQMNLDHMKDYGAAIRIPYNKWRSAAIRNAVCHILSYDSYKTSAQALMKKINNMDGGKEAAITIWDKINDDYYPVDEHSSAGMDHFNEDGTIDVHGVRDLSKLTHNSDGSVDPGGKLIGIEPYSQAEFDARNTDELKNPPRTYAVAAYEGYPFGLTYDKKNSCLYYNGKLVRYFTDIMSSNGETFSSGNFKGSMRQINNSDGKGEVDVYAARDYGKPDADGNGTLTGINQYSQEEFDARTKEQ